MNNASAQDTIYIMAKITHVEILAHLHSGGSIRHGDWRLDGSDVDVKYDPNGRWMSILFNNPEQMTYVVTHFDDDCWDTAEPV